MWMWVVVEEFKILILEVEDILHFRVEAHLGKRTGFACELQIGLSPVNLQPAPITVGDCFSVEFVNASILLFLFYKLGWIKRCTFVSYFIVQMWTC